MEKKNSGRAITDALVPPPVDQESRLSIVDINYAPAASEFIIAPSVEAKLNDFMATIKNKSRMDDVGLEFSMSLLLYGYPGCGKTTAARYISAQMGLVCNYLIGDECFAWCKVV